MEPVRLGVIGCGVISASHLELAAKSEIAQVVAVADLIEDRAIERARQYDIPSHYNSDEELLADEGIDAVILAMPTGDRTPVAYKALERGKHVLLEKPVARSVAEIERMAALQGDRVVGCCSSRYTFHQCAEAAAACFRSGALGKIRTVRVRAVKPAPPGPNDDPPPWRQSMAQNGGGILVNWSSYDLNYMMHIVNWQLKPKTVLARWWPVAEHMSDYVAPGSDADSHYTALVLCEDDIVLSMERAEFSSGEQDQAWEVIGSDASLYMPMGQQVGRTEEVVLSRIVRGKGLVCETVSGRQEEGPSGNVVEDFARAIREGGRPRTDLERALVMQKVTDAIYASAAAGASVEVWKGPDA